MKNIKGVYIGGYMKQQRMKEIDAREFKEYFDREYSEIDMRFNSPLMSLILPLTDKSYHFDDDSLMIYGDDDSEFRINLSQSHIYLWNDRDQISINYQGAQVVLEFVFDDPCSLHDSI